MISSANSDTERKILSILKVLSESSEPLGSITIARELEKHGLSLGERAVRYHLKITDERGYTQPLGIDGRMITSKGLEELKIALAPDQIGFILEKLELLAFRTTFSPDSRTGQVSINTSLFNKDDFPRAVEVMKDVFKAGICVSDLVATASEGQKLGDVVIPNGKIGMATICGVTINGVLLKHGVPMESKFGGVLEIRDFKPRRFVAIINYGGTSLDPSEQYILADACQGFTGLVPGDDFLILINHERGVGQKLHNIHEPLLRLLPPRFGLLESGTRPVADNAKGKIVCKFGQLRDLSGIESVGLNRVDP